MKYHQIVGGLHYILLTRSDLSFSVNNLLQFMVVLKPLHWTTMKCVLWYLSSTQEIDIYKVIKCSWFHNNSVLQHRLEWQYNQSMKSYWVPHIYRWYISFLVVEETIHYRALHHGIGVSEHHYNYERTWLDHIMLIIIRDCDKISDGHQVRKFGGYSLHQQFSL